MIFPYVIIIIIMCILFLLLSLSLELNTIEQNYALHVGKFFRIQYAYCHKQRGLQFFFFGWSWFRRFRFMSSEKRQKKKENGKNTKKKMLLRIVRDKRIDLFQLAVPLKTLWDDLYRLSNRRLEWNLCTSDYMANAVLSVVLLSCGIQGITVNYWGENWFIFSFTIQLWAFLWVLLKFTFSPPVLKMGFSWFTLRLRNSYTA